MKKACVIIAGCGNMAGVLRSVCQEDSRRQFFLFSEDMGLPLGDNIFVAVHFGSGRQLPQLKNWCNNNGVLLIQGSTGQQPPDTTPMPYVEAPNLSLPIIKLMHQVLPVLGQSLGGMEVTITESHQASKKSVPGTAVIMADTFGIAKEHIVSIREPAVQRQLGVPEENLGGHGYHWINFHGQGVNITVSTKVNGRRTYAEGALFIADQLAENHEKLEPRVYQLTDVLQLIA